MDDVIGQVLRATSEGAVLDGANVEEPKYETIQAPATNSDGVNGYGPLTGTHAQYEGLPLNTAADTPSPYTKDAVPYMIPTRFEFGSWGGSISPTQFSGRMRPLKDTSSTHSIVGVGAPDQQNAGSIRTDLPYEVEVESPETNATRQAHYEIIWPPENSTDQGSRPEGRISTDV